jgi:hypothetical protein
VVSRDFRSHIKTRADDGDYDAEDPLAEDDDEVAVDDEDTVSQTVPEVESGDDDAEVADDGDSDGDDVPANAKPPCTKPKPCKNPLSPCTEFALGLSGVIGNFMQYIENYATAYFRYNAALLTLQAVYRTADVEAIIRNAKSVPIPPEDEATEDTHKIRPKAGTRASFLEEAADEDYDVLAEVDLSKHDVMTIPTRLLGITTGLLRQWIIAVSGGMIYTESELRYVMNTIQPVPLTDIRSSESARGGCGLSTMYRALAKMQVRAGVKPAYAPTPAELKADRAIENAASKYRLIADDIQATVLATGQEALRARYYVAQQLGIEVVAPQDLLTGSDPLADVTPLPNAIQTLKLFNEQISRVATLGITVIERTNMLQFMPKSQVRALIKAVQDAVDNIKQQAQY